MKRLSLVFAVPVLLASCTSSAPQGPPQGAGLPQVATGWRETPRVFGLVGERERLGLSSTQIAALDSIGRWISEANREPEERLRNLMGSAPRQRGRPSRGAQEAARPIAEQIATNNLRAMEGVSAVLTDEQKARVCEMESGRREGLAVERRGGRGGDPRIPGALGDPSGPRSLRGDSLFLVRRGWMWCGSLRPSAASAPVADSAR